MKMREAEKSCKWENNEIDAERSETELGKHRTDREENVNKYARKPKKQWRFTKERELTKKQQNTKSDLNKANMHVTKQIISN